MSRRSAESSQEFGSDSFLDIIANIVGILIILIVLAGLKVARQNTVPDLNSTVAQPEKEEFPLDRLADPFPGDVPLASLDPIRIRSTSLPQDPFAQADLLSSSTEDNEKAQAIFRRQVKQLSLELEAKRETSVATETELHDLLDRIREEESGRELLDLRVAAVAQELQEAEHAISAMTGTMGQLSDVEKSFQSTLQSLTERQSEIHDALEEVTEQTRALTEVLDAADAETSGTDRIQHRLSPVGAESSEDELHFRLSGGRISQIPLEALLERLKEQVATRQNIVMRFQRYEGTVGPVGGYHMNYTVERNAISPLQALQYGQNTYRISVSHWSILPGDTLEAEPVAAALQIGSRFRQVLEAASPDTVVTIWLYPADFQYFQELRELAHNLNLRVAARPLPDGTPIAGSPNGSQSTSQ